jgi:hypothetical protein
MRFVDRWEIGLFGAVPKKRAAFAALFISVFAPKLLEIRYFFFFVAFFFAGAFFILFPSLRVLRMTHHI